MSRAVLDVRRAGPLITVQDGGRRGFMRYGVTNSGAMDRAAFALAHAALGNAANGALLEVSAGGLELVCREGGVTISIAGGDFSVLLDGRPQGVWPTLTLETGAVLAVRPGASGSWCYLAFAGTLDAPEWLGSRATHTASGFCGAPLVDGDRLSISGARTLPEREGEGQPFHSGREGAPFRVVIGPQDRFFSQAALAALTGEEFTVSGEYDRMGMRLDGPELAIEGALDMPSSPITRGSLQVPGHGKPICLLADHQTTGGYPKIGTVISADLDRLVQLRSGATVRFAACTAAEAVEAARARAAALDAAIAQASAPRESLAQRLASANLISGIVG